MCRSWWKRCQQRGEVCLITLQRKDSLSRIMPIKAIKTLKQITLVIRWGLVTYRESKRGIKGGIFRYIYPQINKGCFCLDILITRPHFCKTTSRFHYLCHLCITSFMKNTFAVYRDFYADGNDKIQGDESRKDPIAQSFWLSRICRELSLLLNAHSNKLKTIKRELKEFQVRMLNYCNGSDQVFSFFSFSSLH